MSCVAVAAGAHISAKRVGTGATVLARVGAALVHVHVTLLTCVDET